MSEPEEETDRAKPNNKPQNNANNNIGGTSDAALKKEFQRIDVDRSGFIDRNDFKKLFGKFVPDSLITKAISMIDTNKDGKISFTEYKTLRKQIGTIKLPSNFGNK
jgi:Ca2+-binding EF-hand superfamily protein